MNELATGQGILAVTLAQSCRIAEAYDESDIRALGQLVIRHRARFGPSHLSRLLAVQDEGRRQLLVRDAVENRWGVADISRAVQALNGARSHVGKRPNIPQSQPELMAALVAQCVRWERWQAAAKTRLPRSVAGAVKTATTAVQTVKKLAGAKLPTSSYQPRAERT